MTWRTAIGLKRTPTDLALDLIKAAERHGLYGWQHDSANDAIRNGDHVINLANIHLEYAAAPLFSVGRAVRFHDAPLLLRCGLPILPCIGVRRMRLTLRSPGIADSKA